MAFNISDQVLPILDPTANHRQARFGYIPLFGLLLANILSQSVLAKYGPLGAIRLSYEPLPLIKRPAPAHNHDNYNSWDPVSHTYEPTSELDTQHIHHHHHVPPATQNQIVHINDRPPEILIIDSDTDSDQNETTAPAIFTDSFLPLPMSRSSLEKPDTDEPIVAESRAIPQQLLAFLANATTPSSKKVKRGTSRYTKTRKNNKYISQKKRRPTSTTPDYYYDSYEEEEEDATATTRRYQQKRKNPYHQSKPIDSYEESESSISNSYSDLGNESNEYDYESYEITTKPQKKKRRTTTHKPKRYKNNYKVRKPLKVSNLYDYDEFEYDTERIQPSKTTIGSLKTSQKLLLRQQEQLRRQQEQLQRQQELLQRQVLPTQSPSTDSTSTTSSITSSTPPTTTIVTVLVQGNATGPGNNTGYGYGPSNGYEGVSITYSPTGVGPGPSAGGSQVYEVPSPVYTNPSSTYGAPKPSYGVPNPSYSPPSPSYGPPSPSYGPPSNSYGIPSTSSGFSPSVHGYYQVPFSDWYSNDGTRNAVKKVNNIVGFDNVFQ